MTTPNHDYVVIAFRPDGTPIYSTRSTIREYGLAAVRAVANAQIRDELAAIPKEPS